jgi:hypothetical protein
VLLLTHPRKRDRDKEEREEERERRREIEIEGVLLTHLSVLITTQKKIQHFLKQKATTKL